MNRRGSLSAPLRLFDQVRCTSWDTTRVAMPRVLKTVGGSLDELPTKNTNSYLQSWNGRAAGQAPLQRRVIWLLERLGLDPREVAASNPIFPRSREVAGSEFGKLSRLCWPVHEQMLNIVLPQLVIAYGNGRQSPYRFLFNEFAADGDESVSLVMDLGFAAASSSQVAFVSLAFLI